MGISGFLGNLGLLPQFPLLHISAGGHQLCVSDPDLNIYIGTNPPSPLGNNMAAVTFHHPKPVGVTLLYLNGPNWGVFPDEDVVVKLVNEEGKVHHLGAKCMGCLTEGLNRLLFDDQEITVFVPSRNILRGGQTVHFVSLPPAQPQQTIHDKDTGPIKHLFGAVETAAPDDPTKGHMIEEASPRMAQSGFTERIEENAPAVPMSVLTNNGTERLVEKTERLMVEEAAVPRPELVWDYPAWAYVLPATIRASNPEDWARMEELRKRQRDFLLQFQGPRGRSFIDETVLQSAIQFLEKFPSSSDRSDEVSLILSYLGLCRMRLLHPFDLEREIDLMGRHPASLPPLLEMELKELRELLTVEPSETNRQVIRYVLKEAGENVFWLMHPINRVLHLLCRKRADNRDPETLRRYPMDLLSLWGRFCRLSK